MPKESVPQTPRKEKRLWCVYPKWYPSSPAAMCRLWTGNAGCETYVFAIHFPLRVPRAGDLDRPLAARRETAARPDGSDSAQICRNPEAPLQGELAPKATEGSTAKNVREFIEFPDVFHLLPHISFSSHSFAVSIRPPPLSAGGAVSGAGLTAGAPPERAM